MEYTDVTAFINKAKKFGSRLFWEIRKRNADSYILQGQMERAPYQFLLKIF